MTVKSFLEDLRLPDKKGPVPCIMRLATRGALAGSSFLNKKIRRAEVRALRHLHRFQRKGSSSRRMWVKTNFGKLAFLAFITYGLCACSNQDESENRTKRQANGNIGKIDLEKVRKAVIDPSTISNQLTGTVLNDFFTTTGYLIGGKFKFLGSRTLNHGIFNLKITNVEVIVILVRCRL